MVEPRRRYWLGTDEARIAHVQTKRAECIWSRTSASPHYVAHMMTPLVDVNSDMTSIHMSRTVAYGLSLQAATLLVSGGHVQLTSALLRAWNRLPHAHSHFRIPTTRITLRSTRMFE
jgi:hypothetical protein